MELKEPPIDVVRSRLAEYMRNPFDERRELVELWKSQHPEAAAETSNAYKPLDKLRDRHPEEGPNEPDEHWFNDTYYVVLRRRKDEVFKTNNGMIQIGISALDGTARHDFRDFQAIKNQLAGAECEAFELYPAESRLMDPSNYYALWCFPGINRIKVGLDERRVWDADIAMAPQRAFPEKQK